MAINHTNNRRISRRELFQIAGASSLAVIAIGAFNALPGAALAATDTGEDSPEAFLARAYAERARAMSANDPRALDVLYGENARLLAHERDRVAFMHGLGSRWDGTILGYEASVSLFELQVSGAAAEARVYEKLHVLWIPAPRPDTPERRALRQQYPEKFASTTPRGPRGEIDSSIGTRHEVTMEKGANGWRLVRDSYEEPHLHGGSPDLVPGSWSAVWAGLPSNGTLTVGSVPAAPQSEAIAECHRYEYVNAKNYALAHYSQYNPDYCNYNQCGGDCTNFVSQCLRAGDQVDDPARGWNTFNGACGRCEGKTAPKAGTDTWANVGLLRGWLLNSGRGVSKGSINELGMGDVVSYDKEGDGVFDHVALLTEPWACLVTAHNADVCNVPWTLGGASQYLFTWVNIEYCV